MIGKWEIGIWQSCTVSDIPTTEETNTGHDDKRYYGGYLVCESVPTSEIASLIAAAPDLLAACEKAMELIEALEYDGEPVRENNYSFLAAAIAKAKNVK